MSLHFYGFTSAFKQSAWFGIWLRVGCVSLIGLPCVADTITLKNGQTVEGVILKENEERVIVRNSGGEFSINRNKIERIEIELKAENLVRELQEALQFADLDLAKTKTQLALSAGVSEIEVNQLWQAYSENLVQILRNSTLSNRALSRAALLELQADDTFTTPTLFEVARIYHALDAVTNSADTIALVDDDTLHHSPGLPEAAGTFFPRLARSLQQQGHFTDSLEILERLRPMNDDSASNHQVILGLVESAQARNREDYPQAFYLIRNKIAPQAPSVAENRMRLTLREFEVWALQNNQELEARKLIQQYAQSIVPEAAKEVMKTLIVHYLDRLIQAATYEDVFAAVNAIAASEAILPEVTERESLARFRMRYKAIEREDPLQLLELALDAKEEGLEQEAIELLVMLQDNEYMKQTALEQIFMIREEQDLRILNQALEAFDAGNMELTVEICATITEDQNRHSPQMEEIKRLASLARKEIVVQQKARPYMAEALYQEAERSFHLSELDQAYTLVDTILEQYTETPAAERAVRLLADISKAFELELLEGRRKSVPPLPSVDLDSIGPKTESPLPLPGREKQLAEKANEELQQQIQAQNEAINQELQRLLLALEGLE
ncbi:MAG: hypothetical protein ACFCU1_07465 [Sumerlaeia bacterium]